jgi:pimeloyl-ACP methyl ester carboxylesterase
MTTFVLVHGAFEAGWYWRPVAKILRANGYDVFAPSLTGLGERKHLLSKRVDLETHIADILGVLAAEELADVVMVGHSYGGMVITGAADRAGGRVTKLVYLDAFVPKDGEAVFDIVLPERRTALEAAARENGDGWRIPPPPASAWGVTDPELQEWLDRLSVDHPLATMTQKVRLAGAAVSERHFVVATRYDPSPFQRYAAEFEGTPGWSVYAIDEGHMLPVTAPDDVCRILMDVAG